MTRIAKERIVVALDVTTKKEAAELVVKLKDQVGLFKIGLELLSAEGISVVHHLVRLGAKIFYDGKFNDIPNTVAAASKAVTGLGIRMFNIHTLGGTEMMRMAVDATRKQASSLGIERPFVLGVTILTSVDQIILNQQLRIPGRIEDQVVHLAKLAETAGLDGVIASPQEVTAIHSNLKRSMIIVTPGVRPAWAATNDQKRIMSPGEAIRKGASYLVIGRPITKPPSEIGTPENAATLIAKEIAEALNETKSQNTTKEKR